MYNLFIAGAISLLVAVAVALAGFPWYAGIVPALLVFGVATFFLLRATFNAVQAEMLPLQAKLGGTPPRTPAELQQRLDEVRGTLESIRTRYQWWQPLLADSIDAQLGMLDYGQMKYDEALPRLRASRWMQDGSPLLLAGCILWRKKSMSEADEAFKAAAKASPKEVTVHLVPAILYARAGEREKSLAAIGAGLAAVPGQEQLVALQKQVANKQRVDLAPFAELWARFFPEDVQQDLLMRGRRGESPFAGLVGQRAVAGPPASRPRGKLARRR